MQHQNSKFDTTTATFIVCIFSFALNLDASAQDSSWFNAAGGNFLDAANWSDGVPSASDDANFDLDESYNITLGSGHTINSWQQSTGEITLSGGAALSTSADSSISGGTLNLTGPDTRMDYLGDLSVANGTPTGFLNLSSGAQMTTTGSLLLGRGVGVGPGITGNMSVVGADSLFDAGEQLRVGFNSSGNLSISEGGSVSGGSLIIGGIVASSSNVVVSGAGSSLSTDDGSVLIRGEGTFSLDSGAVANNGLVAISGVISGGSPTSGEATVSGMDSHWTIGRLSVGGVQGLGIFNIEDRGTATVSGRVVVGDSSGTLNISGGGQLFDNGGTTSTTMSMVGSGFDANGIVNISGQGSLWSTTGSLDVGISGRGEISISDGGRVSVGQELDFGSGGIDSFGRRGIGLIDGSGSELSTRILRVGGRLDGSLSIANGGLAIAESTSIGVSGTQSGTLSVDGAGSEFRNTGTDFHVGTQGGRGTVNITNGGLITTTGMNISSSSLGTSGTLTIDGPGSQLDTGAVQIDDLGNVQVLNGGVVNNSETLILGTAGDNARLTIHGQDSVWNNTGHISIEGNLRIEGGGGLIASEVDLFTSRSDGIGETTVTGFGSRFNVGNELRIGSSAGDSGSLRLLEEAQAAVSSVRISTAGELEIVNAILTSTGPMISEGNIVFGDLGQIDSNVEFLGPASLEVRESASATIAGNLVHNGSAVEIGHNGELTVQGNASGAGNYGGEGRVVFESVFAPGNSAAVVEFEDFTLADTAELQIELGGIAFGEFDMLHALGDAELGGDLTVSLIDGFELSDGQEFLIVDVDSERSGFFSGLAEGDLIGSYDNVDLFISYVGGDGGDVKLFTSSSIPEPASATLVMLTLAGIVLRRRK